MDKHNYPIYQINFSWRWLMPKYWGAWLTGFVLVLLAFVPVALRDRFAVYLADTLFDKKFLRKRRGIADTNLKLCFPQMSEQARNDVMRKNIRIFFQLMLGAAELMVRSKAYIQQRVEVRGEEHLAHLNDTSKSTVLLLPHCYPVDFTGVYLTTKYQRLAGMFNETRNPVIDWAMTRYRTRFGALLVNRKAGFKTLIQLLKDGYGLAYLPDEDFGPERSLMTPFFAATKASLPVLGRLVGAGNARLLPAYASYDSERHKIVIHVQPPIEGYPSGDMAQDTKRMNEALESLISCDLSSYMWTLKLLKTLPDGSRRQY